MEKTRKEWFNNLPYEIRKKLIDDFNPNMDVTSNTLIDSVFKAMKGYGLSEIYQDETYKNLFNLIFAGRFDKVDEKSLVYDGYPIGSKWLVEVEVVEHDYRDTNCPILISFDADIYSDTWLDKDDLKILKPIKN